MRFLSSFVVATILFTGTISTVRAQNANDFLPAENVFDNLSVDLKINGSDGPVNVAVGERIIISWESDGAKRCRGNWSKNDLRLNGKIAGKLSRSLVSFITVRIACIDGDGNREDDSVVLKITGAVPPPFKNPIVVPPQKLPEKIANIVYDGPINQDIVGDRGVLKGETIVDSFRVLRKFYETHPDIYDFIVIYSAIPTHTQSGSATTVKNGIKGNGSSYPDLDETAKYGSQGKLRLQVFMPPQLGVDNLDVGDQSRMLLHEISHYWLMFVGDIADCQTRPDFSVKCKNPLTGFRVNSDGAHWDSNVDTAVRKDGLIYEDPNGGMAYNFNSGYCTTVAPSQPRQFRFNDIDLYLMGFLSASDVHPIYWYDLQPYNQQLQAQCIQHIISANDIISMHGSRQPAYPIAQREFKIGFILLTAPGQGVTQQQISRIDNIVSNFPTMWYEATRRTSTITIPQ